MPHYEVFVSNVGRVWVGDDHHQALAEYDACVDMSLNGYGRYAGETVDLFMDSEPWKVFTPEDGEAVRTHDDDEDARRRYNIFTDEHINRVLAARGVLVPPFTWRSRWNHWWFVWGNEIAKALFAFTAIGWMVFTLYLWGPLIKSGILHYLGR
jgi:hypothetical protein